MKIFFSLFYGEMYKELRKKTAYILLVLVIALAVLLIGVSKTMNKQGVEVNWNDDIAYYENMLDNLSSTQQSQGERINYLCELQNSRLMQQQQVQSYSDFRYQVGRESYIPLLQDQYAIELLQNGGSLSQLGDWLTLDMAYAYNAAESESEKKQIEEKLQQQIWQVENIITQNDATTYTQTKLDETDQSLATLKEQLKTATGQQAQQLQNSINMLQATRDTIALRQEYNIGYDGNYQDKAIKSMMEKCSSIYQLPMSEQEFEQNRGNYSEFRTMSYQEYLDDFQKEIQKSQNEYDVLKQTIVKQQPMLYLADNDARTYALIALDLLSFVVIAGIVLAGTILSTEHTTGTIRLLMLRPAKRYKIYGSKLLCVVCISTVMYLVLALVTTLLGGFLYGFSWYTIPQTYYSNGIQTVSFWQYGLLRLLYVQIQVVFFEALTLCLSVIFRSAAPSIALPLLFQTFASTATLLLSQKFSWIRYTPLPYTQMQNFVNNASTTYMSQTSLLNLSVSTAAIVMTIYTLLFIFAGTWLFCKRDATN